MEIRCSILEVLASRHVLHIRVEKEDDEVTRWVKTGDGAGGRHRGKLGFVARSWRGPHGNECAQMLQEASRGHGEQERWSQKLGAGEGGNEPGVWAADIPSDPRAVGTWMRTSLVLVEAEP